MDWYEEEIKELEIKKNALEFMPDVVFYGSSSIRQWTSLNQDFPLLMPLNFGFGGSTLEACVHYFDRLFTGLTPQGLIIYAGDNDLGDGKSPEQVYGYFLDFLHHVKERFENIAIGFISIKPSVARVNILDKIKQTNELIKSEVMKRKAGICFINVFDSMLDENGRPVADYFEADGLHINDKGYAIWKEILTHYINKRILNVEN